MPDLSELSPQPGQPLFEIGQLLATPGVMDAVGQQEIFDALNRHIRGDWGNVCDDDKVANDEALQDGLRILSSYYTGDDVKFWILTEADRSATTVLLPEEY